MVQPIIKQKTLLSTKRSFDAGKTKRDKKLTRRCMERTLIRHDIIHTFYNVNFSLNIWHVSDGRIRIPRIEVRRRTSFGQLGPTSQAAGQVLNEKKGERLSRSSNSPSHLPTSLRHMTNIESIKITYPQVNKKIEKGEMTRTWQRVWCTVYWIVYAPNRVRDLRRSTLLSNLHA